MERLRQELYAEPFVNALAPVLRDHHVRCRSRRSAAPLEPPRRAGAMPALAGGAKIDRGELRVEAGLGGSRRWPRQSDDASVVRDLSAT